MADLKVHALDDFVEVVIMPGDPTQRKLKLRPWEAFRLGELLIKQADKAMKKNRGIALFSKREMDNLEESLCGRPTVIQHPPPTASPK